MRSWDASINTEFFFFVAQYAWCKWPSSGRFSALWVCVFVDKLAVVSTLVRDVGSRAPQNWGVWHKVFLKVGLGKGPLPRHVRHSPKCLGPRRHSPKKMRQAINLAPPRRVTRMLDLPGTNVRQHRPNNRLLVTRHIRPDPRRWKLCRPKCVLSTGLGVGEAATAFKFVFIAFYCSPGERISSRRNWRGRFLRGWKKKFFLLVFIFTFQPDLCAEPTCAMMCHTFCNKPPIRQDPVNITFF